MVCDFLPLIWATKPTPQASCSLAGSYSPCLSKPMMKSAGEPRCSAQKSRTAEYTCVIHTLQGFGPRGPLLHRGENRFTHQLLVYVALKPRPADRFENNEPDFSLGGFLVDRHQLKQPIGRKRRS